MPFGGKPIIGIVGGVASGKSFVSGVLRSLGCFVIDSDSIAHQIYRRADVINTLRNWYGDAVLGEGGEIDRKAIAARVFPSLDERRRLEAFMHPLINEHRDLLMRQRAGDNSVRAFVWDSPLLIEAGLNNRCDALIMVDTPRDIRLRRARDQRGWDEREFERREKSQLPLELKRQLATDIVRGDLDEATLRVQLNELMNRVTSHLTGQFSGGN